MKIRYGNIAPIANRLLKLKFNIREDQDWTDAVLNDEELMTVLEKNL